MTRLKTKEIASVKLSLLELQKYICPLCRRDLRTLPEKDWCLDHDHGSGLIRGVLCRNCNGCEGRIFNLARRAKGTGTVMLWLQRLLEYYMQHEAEPSDKFHPTYRTEDEKRLRRNKKARERRKLKK